MNWFHNLCITFRDGGDRGFGILNDSCTSYTPAQQWIVTVFMIAFGVNFSFYYLFLLKKVGKRAVWKRCGPISGSSWRPG